MSTETVLQRDFDDDWLDFPEPHGKGSSSRHCIICGDWLDDEADWVGFECSECILEEFLNEDDDDDD